MRLTRKLVLALVVAIVVVMAVDASLQFRRELDLFDDDMAGDQEAMGRVVQVAVRAAIDREGPAAAFLALDGFRRSQQRVGLRWLPAESPDAQALPADVAERLAVGQPAHVVRSGTAGDDRHFTYVPVQLADGRPAGAIELSEPLQVARHFVRRTELHILATLIVLLACAVAITVWIGITLVGRPMRLLTAQARRIGAGDLTQRIRLVQRDEIGELAEELDASCDRLAAANERIRVETEARIDALEQLRHADRLKTVGLLASTVAHELGTPINVVRGRAKLITDGRVAGAALHDNARIIVEQSDRMVGIIRSLLDFTRRRGIRRTATDVGALVRRTADMLAVYARTRRVAIDVDGPDRPVTGALDPAQLQQALANVMVNGIQAMPDGGRLRVRVAGGDDAVCTVTVEDEGGGIAPGDLPHIFEPFFTTKPSGEGTGLGLAVVHGIVTEHGGHVRVDSTPGRGTRFHIVLPVADATRAQAS